MVRIYEGPVMTQKMCSTCINLEITEISKQLRVIQLHAEKHAMDKQTMQKCI